MENVSLDMLREDYDAQRNVLAVIQAEQIDMFNRPGEDGISILDKVRSRLSVGPDVPIGQPKAAVRKQRFDESSDSSTVYCVVLDTTTFNASGNEVMNRKQVPVAEEYQGVIVSRGRFNNDEATALIGMIKGLNDACEMGLLPGLSPDCTYIHNPSTAIMRVAD